MTWTEGKTNSVTTKTPEKIEETGELLARKRGRCLEVRQLEVLEENGKSTI